MGDIPETETGAAFVAGVATATATEAEQTATLAEARAAEAEHIAVAAVEEAAQASETAYDARAAVAALEEKLIHGLDEIRELITSPQGATEGGEPTPEPGAVPAPERKTGETVAVVEPSDDTPKPRRGYGSRAWFGNS